MARTVSNGAILQVKNVGNSQGETVMNVWHYLLSTQTAGSLDGDTIVDAARLFLQPAAGNNLLVLLRAMSNENCNWQGVHYQWIFPTRYSPTVHAQGSGAGTVQGPAMPTNVAGVVQCETTIAIRGGQGRKHFTGLSDQDITANTMTGVWQLNVEEVMSLMSVGIPLTGIGANSFLLPCIYHRTLPSASQVWSVFRVKTTARVMRRRTAGLGI